MALIIADRVVHFTTSTGTGNLTLENVPQGMQSLASAGAIVNDTFFGVIEAVDVNGKPTGEWETDLFTLVSPTSVARTTLGASSAGAPTKTNFSAGTKKITLCVTAAQIHGWAGTSGVSPAPPSDPTPTGQSGSWTLTLNEEFSSLNSQRWRTTDFYLSNDPTINYGTASDELRIWPLVNNTGNFFNQALHTKPGSGFTGFTQLYGFFEAELLLPAGAGLRPIFGLFRDPDFEISHSMYTGAPVGLWANSSLQAIDFQTAEAQWSVSGNTERAKDFITVPNLTTTGLHKFGIKWQATTIEFYFDGSKVGSTFTHSRHQTAMFLAFALKMVTDNEYPPAVGSGTPSTSNPFTPQGSSNPFRINYVRAWQFA